MIVRMVIPCYPIYRLGTAVIKIVSKIAGITSIVSRKMILQVELNLGQDLADVTTERNFRFT